MSETNTKIKKRKREIRTNRHKRLKNRKRRKERKNRFKITKEYKVRERVSNKLTHGKRERDTHID